MKFYLLEKNRQICIRTLYSKKTFNKLLPLFKLVDFGVSLLYMKKGMLKEKRRADEYIKKNKNYISKRYSKLQKQQIINDNEVTQKFSDNVQLPQGSFDENGILNSILKNSSKFANSLIL